MEVKSTASATGSAPVPVIGNLNQLDAPEVGQLYIFSLHVADDALASNSLPLLIERINSALSHDTEATTLFSERLAKAGYHKASSILRRIGRAATQSCRATDFAIILETRKHHRNHLNVCYF